MADDALRLEKKVKVRKRTITVYEISVGDFRKVLASGVDLETMDPVSLVKLIAPLACDLPVEDIDGLGLQGAIDVFDAFKGINPGFFELARRTGLTEKANAIKGQLGKMFSEIWTEISADLSDADTSTLPGTD